MPVAFSYIHMLLLCPSSAEYRFIHVEDYSDQIGTKDASPGVSRRINVLISSDGLIPDSSQHLKCLCKKKLHFIWREWAFRTSENSHINTMELAFKLFQPEHHILPRPST